jgi:hypothetical protein
MKKTTKSSSDARDAVLKQMKQKAKELKDRSEGKGGGGNIWDELQYGKNLRRILPPADLSPQFYYEAPQHFRVGPDEKTVRCIGDGCPICKRFEREVARINKKYGRGDEAGKAAYRDAANAFKAKARYFMNVINVGKTGDRNTVLVLGVGEQTLQPLLQYYFDDETGCGDFCDPETGRTMIIEKTGNPKKPKQTRYTVRMTEAAKPLANWDALREDLHDLEKAAGPLLSSAKIEAILEGTDEDDDKADTEEDEEEEASDEDVDDYGEESDEEDEDESPKKTTKTKLRDKARGKESATGTATKKRRD